MNVSLYQAASGMNATSRWQEVISENLAASQVPGFKRQDVSFESVSAGLGPLLNSSGPGYVQPRAITSTDFSPAAVRSTNVKTDLAIEGNGFFAVQLPSGEVGYTRDGEFHRSPSGQLVTKQGYSVLGEGGPIQLNANDPELSISSTGEISQKAGVLGKVRVVDFSNPQLLTPVGGGNFVAQNPGLKSRDVDAPIVRQGYLELANSNSVAEMAHMITALRMFEMNQRVAVSQDERMGKMISELSAGN